MARHVFVVSRHHPRLYDYLIDRFRDDGNVQVVLDRRVSERRAPRAPDSQESERRSTERRRPIPADDDLNMRSHMIVTIDEESKPA